MALNPFNTVKVQVQSETPNLLLIFINSFDLGVDHLKTGEGWGFLEQNSKAPYLEQNWEGIKSWGLPIGVFQNILGNFRSLFPALSDGL